MEKKRILNYLFKVLVALVIFLLISLTILSLVMFFATKIGQNEYEISHEDKEVYQYRHLIYNPETRESITGFISTYNEMPSDYVTYENSDGNHVLISNYGTREFECSVKCYCENSEGGRRTARVMGRTVTYLVAAASSIAAYRLAEDHLQQKCSEYCPYVSFFTRTDDMEEFDDDDDDSFEYDRDTHEEDADIEDEDGVCRDALGFDEASYEWAPHIGKEIEEGKHNPMIFVNFMCNGHCITKDFDHEAEESIWHDFNGEVIKFPDFAQRVADEYKCEEMKMEHIVDFLDDHEDIFEQEKKARMIFTNVYLSLYCEDHSHVRFDEFKETYQKLSYDEIGDKDDHTASVCLGYDRKTFKNAYVYCRKTSQEQHDPPEEIYMGGAS